MKIKGNKAIITNGAIESIYEIQPNGDLIKLTENAAASSSGRDQTRAPRYKDERLRNTVNISKPLRSPK